MADRYVEVTRRGWFSRMGGAVMGVLVGLVMVPGSMVLLFWNEGRAVKDMKTLAEGRGQVVSISADAVDPAREGKLVHLGGLATTDETLTDPATGVSAQGIRLGREAEMYQWKEKKESRTRSKVGGGSETETTYDYEKAWLPKLESSNDFKHAAGHENPGSMPIEGASFVAEQVTLGAFELSGELVSQIGGEKPMGLAQVPSGLQIDRPAQIHDGRIYLGETPSAPQVGDVRIGYELVEPARISVVARQEGRRLVTHRTQVGGTIALVEMGDRSAEAMFEAAETRSAILTWVLRGVGALLVFIGVGIILKPISVFADVLPIMGRMAGCASFLVALPTSIALSTLTIGVAWIFFRPLLGILLFTVAALMAGAVLALVLRSRGAKAAAA